jgi:hypothetical protein
MSERSIEEFLADLEARAIEQDEHERMLLESLDQGISTVRSAVSVVSRLRSASGSPSAGKQRPRFCGHCGAPLAAEHSFCTQCGQPIET